MMDLNIDLIFENHALGRGSFYIIAGCRGANPYENAKRKNKPVGDGKFALRQSDISAAQM